MKNLLFCLFIALILSVNSFAQELTPLEIAKKTIEANGGENWRRPKTLQLSGTATIIWNGKTYTLDNYKMWRVFPDANDNARGANGKVRFDAFAGDKLFFQIAFDGKNTVQNLSDDAKAKEEMLKWSNNSAFQFLDLLKQKVLL